MEEQFIQDAISKQSRLQRVLHLLGYTDWRSEDDHILSSAVPQFQLGPIMSMRRFRSWARCFSPSSEISSLLRIKSRPVSSTDSKLLDAGVHRVRDV